MRTTSKKNASKAGKTLRHPKASKSGKTTAASALSRASHSGRTIMSPTKTGQVSKAKIRAAVKTVVSSGIAERHRPKA